MKRLLGVLAAAVILLAGIGYVTAGLIPGPRYEVLSCTDSDF